MGRRGFDYCTHCHTPTEPLTLLVAKNRSGVVGQLIPGVQLGAHCVEQSIERGCEWVNEVSDGAAADGGGGGVLKSLIGSKESFSHFLEISSRSLAVRSQPLALPAVRAPCFLSGRHEQVRKPQNNKQASKMQANRQAWG